MLLLKSDNYLFNVNANLNRINRVNFSINGRCYDPTNQASMLPTSLSTTVGSNIPWGVGSATINMDTAMGMPYFHENRYIGKAGFVYSF